MTGSNEVIPAASLIVFRDADESAGLELLLMQRSDRMRFAAGAAVFPGGRIDAEDRELASSIADPAEMDDVSARVAAIRETLEETGLLVGINRKIEASEARDARALLLETKSLSFVLERLNLKLAIHQLVPFARWVPRHDRAFDTRFFMHHLGSGEIELRADMTETTRVFWSTASRAIEMADSGDISIIYPTRRNLERLAQFRNYADACKQAAEFPIEPIIPYQEARKGEPWLLIPSGHGYPVLGEPVATVKRG